MRCIKFMEVLFHSLPRIPWSYGGQIRQFWSWDIILLRIGGSFLLSWNKHHSVSFLLFGCMTPGGKWGIFPAHLSRRAGISGEADPLPSLGWSKDNSITIARGWFTFKCDTSLYTLSMFAVSFWESFSLLLKETQGKPIFLPLPLDTFLLQYTSFTV